MKKTDLKSIKKQIENKLIKTDKLNKSNFI